MQKITVGIKTFCRPKCLEFNLNHFSKSLYCEKVQFIIADDSNERCKVLNANIVNKYKNIGMQINHLQLEFDSGLSVGRNMMVDNCTTEFILILDDSRTIDTNTNLIGMVQFMEDTKYDLIAGIIKQRHGIDRTYCKVFKKIENSDENVIIFTENVKESIPNKYFSHTFKSDIVLNVFMARTDILKDVIWRPELKVGEHEAFFYDLFCKKYKCAVTSSLNFLQASNEERQYPPDITNIYRTRDKVFKKRSKVTIYM